MLREGLARLFADAGHEVVATVGDASTLTEVVTRDEPDLVVLDVWMPPTHTDDGARAARETKVLHPDVGVLVLSQHIETAHVVELVCCPGFGYVLKDRVLQVEEFLEVSQRVVSAARPGIPGSWPRHRAARSPPHRPRTRSAGADGRGLTNAGIAQKLVLSQRTVVAHVGHVLEKLGIPRDPGGQPPGRRDPDPPPGRARLGLTPTTFGGLMGYFVPVGVPGFKGETALSKAGSRRR